VGTLLAAGGMIFLAAYFLPTIVACCRDVPGKFWIFVFNLLFGFSGIGYLIVFLYACGPSKAQLRWQARREQLSIAADEATVWMANRARAVLQQRTLP